jgi:hypothetical protein
MKYIVAFSIIAFSNNAFSQKREKVYFLADTINISKNNRVLCIQKNSPYEWSYIFYCKCVEPNKQNLVFSYIEKKGMMKAEISDKLPTSLYISIKKLYQLVSMEQRNFDKKYELFITEVLKSGKYKTVAVNMSFLPLPTVDSINLQPIKN